ncbi:putative ribonuclease H-like domain-containing protein [Tanacetum coccineum]
MDDFCREKGIKREYSIARTPQQNSVAERRNRILIKAARTMLVDSKLPTTFWAEAVSTACYVQNRVLVVKPHNKTPYELFRGFKPALGFMRPFGCHVTILNTLDSLGKFDGKNDKGFFVGYSLNSKAFMVYNTRTKRVEENLHIGFLENKPMIEGTGLKWLFDIDSLTQSMNYVLVTAGTISNDSAGTSEENNQDCIVMPIWKDTSYFDSPTKNVDNGEPKTADDAQKQTEDGLNNENTKQERFVDDNSSKDVNAIGQQVNTASLDVNTGSLKLNDVGPSIEPTSLLMLYLIHPGWRQCKKVLLQFKLQQVWIIVDLPNGSKEFGTKWVSETRKMKRGIDGDSDDVDVHLYRSMIGSFDVNLTASRTRYHGFACKKQTMVATSTTEAEYVAAASSCGQVGDEDVHKELGDRMERAATTASSLEVEQDSGSGPMCQDTILGDVNVQTGFEITSKQSIDPPLSRGYTLRSGEDSMKIIGIDCSILDIITQARMIWLANYLERESKVSSERKCKWKLCDKMNNQPLPMAGNGISSISIGSSNVQPSESPYLPVLFIGTSQSRQHDKSESVSYCLTD